MAKVWLALIALLLFSGLVLASEATPLAEDPALEAHMMRIAENMRCLECQNETLAASHAELAADLRQQIREMLKAGRSDQQIVDYMVERYGDFVLYKPPFKPTTWLLWLGPFGLLLLAAWTMVRAIRQRADVDRPSALTPDQEQEAQRLLGASVGKESSS